jgi:hypothetical protein
MSTKKGATTFAAAPRDEKETYYSDCKKTHLRIDGSQPKKIF